MSRVRIPLGAWNSALRLHFFSSTFQSNAQVEQNNKSAYQQFGSCFPKWNFTCHETTENRRILSTSTLISTWKKLHTENCAKIKTQHQTATLSATSTQCKCKCKDIHTTRASLHSFSLLSHRQQHPPLEFVSRAARRVETLHIKTHSLLRRPTSFVLACILRRPNCMQIKWRWKCDINDNRHWNETKGWEDCSRVEADVSVAIRDVEIIGKSLIVYLHDARCAIKHLQSFYCRKLIVKWKLANACNIASSSLLALCGRIRLRLGENSSQSAMVCAPEKLRNFPRDPAHTIKTPIFEQTKFAFKAFFTCQARSF